MKETFLFTFEYKGVKVEVSQYIFSVFVVELRLHPFYLEGYPI